MSLRVIFKPSARLEYAEAAAWYENQRQGLGSEFRLEVKRALQLAQNNPERFPKVRQQARQIRLRRFSKYSIYFAVNGETLSVLAVYHSSRNPEELTRRLG
jgi:plasmid stabilization system protein ParE